MLRRQTEKSFFFNILNIARGTQINSSLILNLLIGGVVEYFGDVVFCYFLLADNSGCYTLIPRSPKPRMIVLIRVLSMKQIRLFQITFKMI